MSTESMSKENRTNRRAEENYLRRTLSIANANVENYGREVARMQEDIDEMLAHYHDNDVEVFTILNNTVTMHTHMKRALERNEKARNKPYFGRIIFHDEALDKEESVYIGKGGIAKDTTHWMVVDWRAPVANAYYENNLGKCSYCAPGGVEMKIDLELKRTYEIEEGKLLDYFDSEVVANDELLTKYLAKNKEAVLSEIVATIQKEQNEIIRKSPYHNVIVQGVAGSGKTTVAMHRISFILYNYTEKFRPEDFYIVGSNRILLDYITGVLPDLDVHGVKQMTMEQLFVRLLYEDWDEKKYRIKGVDRSGNGLKGRSGWFEDLEEYCRRLEWEKIPRESILLNPNQFVEGYQDGKLGVFDRSKEERDAPTTNSPDCDKAVSKSGEKGHGKRNVVCLMKQDAVERYILQNPGVSIQNKINMLNERLMNKVKEEFLGKGISYTEAEKKAILKAYRGRYGGRAWKQSIFEMYGDFLRKQSEKGYRVQIPETEFDVYDLAALAYLYARVKEKEVISEAHHIVIDEAQDFGMMAYRALKFCVRGCTYTVMGDVSQNIHFGYGLNDWEELRGLLLTDAMDSFGILKKSYRNTVEISDFATNILHHGRFFSYPVEPIIRHGSQVRIQKLADRKALLREGAEICKAWQKKGLDTIAVICREGQEAVRTAAELAEYVEVMESDLEKATFGSGIMVLPVEYTKGLEFDAVLIFAPTREEYPVDDGHAKLLYVAATRALHELCVLHMGNLTGLIADPLPQRGMAGKDNIVIANAEPQTLDVPCLNAKNPGKENPNKESTNKEDANKENINTKYTNAENASTEKASIGSPHVEKPGISVGLKYKAAKPTAGIAATPEDKKPYITRRHETGEIRTDITSKMETAKIPSKRSPINARLRKPGDAIGFGDMPATEKLRPAGHAKIDLAVRWVEKKKDGIYMQSRYGTLRLSPLCSTVVRVTFVKGGVIRPGEHPLISLKKAESPWMYKTASQAIELMTDELYLQVEKAGGAIRYMTRDKKRLLLAERKGECRQLEACTGLERGMVIKMRTWLYLDWAKGENIYGIGPNGKKRIKLRGAARYISYGENAGKLPLILSDKGYGIVIGAKSPVICCDIPAYGSYIHGENEEWIDYYFIAGNEEEIMENYGRLFSFLSSIKPDNLNC